MDSNSIHPIPVSAIAYETRTQCPAAVLIGRLSLCGIAFAGIRAVPVLVSNHAENIAVGVILQRSRINPPGELENGIEHATVGRICSGSIQLAKVVGSITTHSALAKERQLNRSVARRMLLGRCFL